jgi:spoIIIJ-associated protein
VSDTETVEEVTKARELLAGILERMSIPAEINASESEEQIELDIACEREEDLQRIIGRRGQVVDALQHLVSKMLARTRTERGKPLVVDAGGYRARHVERLEGLASKMAEKCLESGEEVDLNPMSPADRRVVHMAIARLDGVSTRSEGEGEDRHVVVVPGES